MTRIGLASARSADCAQHGRSVAGCSTVMGIPDGHPPVIYDGWQRRPRIAYNAKNLRKSANVAGSLAKAKELLIEESLLGWKSSRWKWCATAMTIASSSARLKISTDGVHTGDSITVAPGADADRQGIPDIARCFYRGAARDRRGHRRLQCTVFDQPGRWAMW